MSVLLGIDVDSLAAWWEQHIPASHAPLWIDLIAGGHSNLTYRVRDREGQEFALRRPPLGDLPRSAHDVSREFTILKALKPTELPVPPVEAECRELEVIGAPFHVMRWVDGAIIDRPARVTQHLPDPESRAGGFPDREAMVARYAKRTGFSVDNLNYYRAFSYWRIAVIAEGIKRRYESGAMAEHVADSTELDRCVRARADLADRFLTLADG